MEFKVMKQTVEGAAIEGAAGYNIVGQTICKLGFKAGAEWQVKQSPWVSVEERLPEDDNDYIVLLPNGIIGVGIYKSDAKMWNINGIGIVRNVFLWMPIPSFDQIIEDNKDVLLRMKEK